MTGAGGATIARTRPGLVVCRRTHDEGTDGDELSVQDRPAGDVFEAVREEVFRAFFEAGVAERVAPPAISRCCSINRCRPSSVVACQTARSLRARRWTCRGGNARVPSSHGCSVTSRVTASCQSICAVWHDSTSPMPGGERAGACACGTHEIEVDVHHRRRASPSYWTPRLSCSGVVRVKHASTEGRLGTWCRAMPRRQWSHFAVSIWLPPPRPIDRAARLAGLARATSRCARVSGLGASARATGSAPQLGARCSHGSECVTQQVRPERGAQPFCGSGFVVHRRPRRAGHGSALVPSFDPTVSSNAASPPKRTTRNSSAAATPWRIRRVRIGPQQPFDERRRSPSCASSRSFTVQPPVLAWSRSCETRLRIAVSWAARRRSCGSSVADVDHVRDVDHPASEVPALEAAVRCEAFVEVLGMMQVELARPERLVGGGRDHEVVLVVLAVHRVRVERDERVRPPTPDLADDPLAQCDLAASPSTSVASPSSTISATPRIRAGGRQLARLARWSSPRRARPSPTGRRSLARRRPSSRRRPSGRSFHRGTARVVGVRDHDQDHSAEPGFELRQYVHRARAYRRISGRYAGAMSASRSDNSPERPPGAPFPDASRSTRWLIVFALRFRLSGAVNLAPAGLPPAASLRASKTDAASHELGRQQSAGHGVDRDPRAVTRWFF